MRVIHVLRNQDYLIYDLIVLIIIFLIKDRTFCIVIKKKIFSFMQF